MLGCTAVRSYVLSLFDKILAGVGGTSPSANEVLRDDRRVFFSSLSSRLESMEFVDRGAVPFIHSGEK